MDTSLPGSSSSERRKGGNSTAARNRAAHAARDTTFDLEDSRAPSRPSRRSTRKGKNRVKPETNLERRQKRRTHSPAARVARVAAHNSNGARGV
jgi:hypothetical protein